MKEVQIASGFKQTSTVEEDRGQKIPPTPSSHPKVREQHLVATWNKCWEE
jgi:hypothetical protein